MSKDLLLEIGTEEIPARFMTGILNQIETIAKNKFAELRIAFDEVQAYGTPRRIALIVKNVADKQEDISSENKGPSIKVAFDAEGNFLNKISYDYKVYSLRTAMGRGRDGKVYAVLRDSVADDGTSVIVELDGRDGHIGDATSFMLRSDGSFYSNVCPGRDCDLVIFGGEGILGYDLGSANIKWKVPAGKLPFSTEGFYPMAALADGRILFLDSNKLHYVPAAQQ